MDGLDTLVRRVDEDRWLASRFAPEHVRKRLIAIYAVNYEIARIGESVREPGLGEIKLQWWREAIAEIFDGSAARSHPALVALRQAITEAPLSKSRFDQIIEARRQDLVARPFATRLALWDYIESTSKALMYLGIEACGVTIKSGPVVGFVGGAGLYWALAGIYRSEPSWRARGRELFPPAMPHEPDLFTVLSAAPRVIGRASPALPSDVFPALGYATLLRAYVRRNAVCADVPLFQRQLRLIFASATGRY